MTNKPKAIAHEAEDRLLAPYQGVPATHDALAAAKQIFDSQQA